MPRVRYINKRFTADSQAIIDAATGICAEYQGVSLTLRQLYYQFVARDLVPNSQQSYNRIGAIIADARMAGEFDWDNIIDRTRNLVSQSTWSSPADLLRASADQYRADLWAPQKRRVEVWIEKDAAIGVIERVCRLNGVPYFSCRGYTSASEMWSAATRVGEYLRNGEQTLILHVGDHDPSGLDMTRDIEDRLRLFVTRDWVNEFGMPYGNTRGAIRTSQWDVMHEAGWEDFGSLDPSNVFPWEVRRIALTIEQIEQYSPPPNYAKTTDARFRTYFEQTGLDESWELDALDPFVMENLIQDHIDGFRREEQYAAAERKQEQDRQTLITIAEGMTS